MAVTIISNNPYWGNLSNNLEMKTEQILVHFTVMKIKLMKDRPSAELKKRITKYVEIRKRHLIKYTEIDLSFSSLSDFFLTLKRLFTC